MALRPVSTQISSRLKKLQTEIDKIPAQAHIKFTKTTPIKTGNARKNTKFTNSQSGGQILGDYSYANRLNEGYSKQAPSGMTTPTINYLRSVVKRMLGN